MKPVRLARAALDELAAAEWDVVRLSSEKNEAIAMAVRSPSLKTCSAVTDLYFGFARARILILPFEPC